MDEEIIAGAPGGDDQPSSLERAQQYMKEHPEGEAAPLADPKPEIPPAVADPAKPAEVKPADKPADKPAEPKPAEEVKPAEAPKVDEKVILESPQYKEAQTTITTQKAILDEIKPLLSNERYPIASATELKAVLDDSFVLYDIAAGKGKVGDLLSLFEKNWTKDRFDAVMLDLADFLKAKGVEVPTLDPRNPEHREILELKRRDSERETATTQEKVETARKEAVSTLQSSVAKLAEKIGVDKDDVHDYALIISAKVGADPKMLKLLEQGKAGAEIERLFTEHHNRELQRQKRWLDAKVAAKSGREEQLPNTPTREAGPAPKSSEKPFKDRKELGTSEGRVAAAKKFWDSSETGT